MPPAGLHKRWLLTFSLALLCLAGIDSRQASAQSPKPEDPEILRIYMGPFMDFGPLFIALEEGFFEEQGIRLEVVRLSKSTDAIPALLNKQLDVVPAMVSSATVNAIAKGRGMFKAVATMSTTTDGPCSYAALVARKGLCPGGVLSREILSGKKFELPPAGMRQYFLDTWLESFDLGTGDIQTTYMPKPVVGEALAKGSLDFSILSEPWLSRVLQAGQAEIVTSFESVLPNAQFAVILFGPSLLADRPIIGRGFVVAYLKGVRQYLQGKTDRNLEILAKHTGMEMDFLGTVCLPGIRADGHIIFKSVEDFQDWALKQGFIDEALDERSFWDPSMVEDARRILSEGSP